MKRNLSHLKRGDLLQGYVEEVMAEQQVIVNFGGDLVRVTNDSGRTLFKGEKLLLIVTTISPLGFQLFKSSPLQKEWTA